MDVMPWVLASWAALHAGTLWLNAALDQDDGEVLLGRSVPVPEGTRRVAGVALALALLLAVPAGPGVWGASLCCVVLAVIYSWPGLAWKGHPLGGPFVNLLGYGFLSPVAGWVVVGVPANPRTLAVAAGVATAVLGAYFAAQAFQGPEDRARGYRTLVATHGPAIVLRAARLCLALAWLDATVLAAVGWLPRASLLGVPLFWWVDRGLAGWERLPSGGGARDAAAFVRRVVLASVVVLTAVAVQYAVDSARGGPVAGLATAAGRPDDRSVAAWRAERRGAR
jgi:4-hydroxybenzoate polyprenyltransferase